MHPRPLQKRLFGELESLVDGQPTIEILRTVMHELQQRSARKKILALMEKIEALLSQPRPTAQTTPSQVKAEREPVVSQSLSRSQDGEGELAPHLSEFVIALRLEIEAAKRNAGSSAYLLTEGKLIAPVGNSYHYRFQSQRRLRVPPDTDGDFHPGNGSALLKVTVIEIHDNEVTLAVPERLPPPALQGKLITDLSMLLEKLIERIESKGLSQQPSADRILGFAVPSGGSLDFTPINSRLNAEQRQAVSSVLGMDTVFLWGPPGTGKTQTIGEIGAQLFQRDKTLLLVSHTNTAVDEALLRIAQSVEGKFNEGEILRLGEPVKSELLARPDLILKRVAEKRSAELEQQKKALEKERLHTLAELEIIHRRVDLLQWLEQDENDIQTLQNDWKTINDLSSEHAKSEQELARLKENIGPLQEKANAANLVSNTERELINIRARLSAANEDLEQNRLLKNAADLCFRTAHQGLRQAEAVEPLRKRHQSMPGEEQLQQEQHRLGQAIQTLENDKAMQHAKLMSAKEVLASTLAVGAIKRLWQKLPHPDAQTSLVLAEEKSLTHLGTRLSDAVAERDRIHQMLEEVRQLKTELSVCSHIPSLNNAQNAYQAALCDVERLTASRVIGERNLEALVHEEQTLTQSLNLFIKNHGSPPSAILHQLSEQLAAIEPQEQEVQALKRQISTLHRCLKEKILSLCHVLQEWNLLPQIELINPTLDALIKLVLKAQTKARQEVGTENLPELTVKRDRMSALVASLMDEIRAIEEELKVVEEKLLANVRVLATTLTRAYMRSGVQSRIFDTVLVDEASMAPIPALWASATLAERCIVAVGDFKQLPPIVLSEDPIALRWLGRDVFDASGVQGAYERNESPKHFVALREQHRMHPQISSIVNDLVYQGLLRDGSSVSEPTADDAIRSWYSADLDATTRVTLLNTATADCWNTTSDKSRFNPLSAMTLVELTRTWFKAERSMPADSDRKRVLMISPYRPHAKLLDIMVRTDGQDDEIMANTVHSFQGSEADAVIVDLVSDYPHYNANLLTAAVNEDIMRLLNVAITRARRRLIILGNFDWFRKKGGQAFVGKHLLPRLHQEHRPYNIVTVMNSRADGQRILSSQQVQNAWQNSLSDARQQIVIFSPQLCIGRAHEFIKTTQPLIAKGSQVVLITELPVGRKMAAEGALHSEIRQSGILLVYKHKMTEKLLLIDQQEVWSGTFPLLGVVPDKGYYVRRRDKKLAAELADMYGLTAILEAYTPLHLCPVCSSDMSLADARDGSAYYWRCTTAGCYTRAFNTPAPVDGVLLPKCGSLPVFGYWGTVPYWLCTCAQGGGHRIKMQAMHLKLPKMEALIPARSRNKVYRHFDINPPSASESSSDKEGLL